MAKMLQLPLNENGLYRACDIIRMAGFPYGKTWLYNNIKENGSFIKPVKKGSATLFLGSDINDWFKDFEVMSSTLS